MAAQRLVPTDENVQRAATALLQGGIVAMPTETVYGLAGVAFNEQALASIFAAKERPTFDPLICHVAVAAEGDWLAHLQRQGLVATNHLSDLARQRLQQLAHAFWPGPLTIVLPKQPQVPDLATSGLPTVGVRCPRHPVAQRLLAAVGSPLAAPSANRFGRISPTAPEHVEAELGDRIALILDGGPCEIGIESTVVLLETSGDIRLLRPGGVTRKELEQTIGAPILDPPRQGDTGATPLPSPGLLASHYAPRKPLAITTLPELEALSSESLARTGVILAAGPAPHFTWSPGRLVVLSPSGDLAIAAQRLFAALRALDEDVAVDRLLATLCADESGLGFAINDRLRKASHA